MWKFVHIFWLLTLITRLNICPCLLGAVMPSDFVESVITDASVGTDPLGYAIAVTDDNVVTVHCTTDDTERDYAASLLKQYRGTVTESSRQRARRHVQQVTIYVEVEDQNDSDDQQDATVRTEDSISCDDQHDPADAPVSEDDLGRIAQEAATAIAGVAHRSACMCCQRSVQDDSCTTVNLSTPAPSHYAVRLKVPDNADLPAGLVAFYLVTGDAIDESWSSLMLCQTSMFTSHDGEPCASLCEQCCGALKDRKSVKPPTMSIANGNWWGSASAIPELADLTESEWTFLTQGRCGTAAVRYETVVAFEHQVPISRDNADGTTVHPKRPKLTRHMVVRRATPAETLRRLQGCTAPALKVHLCVGNLRTDADVRAAIAESKRKITINVPRVRTAHAWLVSNNVGFENDVLGDVDADADHVLQNVLTVTGHGRECAGMTSMPLWFFLPEVVIHQSMGEGMDICPHLRDSSPGMTHQRGIGHLSTTFLSLT